MECISFKTKDTIILDMRFYITPVYTIFYIIVFHCNCGGFLSTMVAFVFCVLFSFLVSVIKWSTLGAPYRLLRNFVGSQDYQISGIVPVCIR